MILQNDGIDKSFNFSPWISLNSLILSVLSGASVRSVFSMHFMDSFTGTPDFKKAMFACAITFST